MATAPTTMAAAATRTHRRRATASLFVSVAAMSTSMAGTSTVGTLLASAAVGTRWSGIASTSGILGTACGSLLLGAIMAKRGRKAGILTGFAVAVLGALIAASGAMAGRFPLLLLGLVGIGIGNAAGQLARYAAADYASPERRAMSLGIVVWAGTVGGIAGPSLIAPAAEAARALHLGDLAGTYLLAVLLTTLAGVSACFLPSAGAPADDGKPGDGSRTGVREALRSRTVWLALAAMVCGQVTMVAVMTMTPVHLQHQGHGLGTVGGVLTAHMVGMFALAPLSGKLADRFGGARVIVGGSGTLVLATILAVGWPMSLAALPVALFLLGYGWNLCFVGGSSLLSRDLPAAQKLRLQGIVDALVWSSAAVAGLASGQLLALGDYSFLAGVAGMVALVPMIFVFGRQRR